MEMGVTGKFGHVKNYFEHPTEKNRKVYVFSDTPHPMKTIRNRLYNNCTLQMDPAEPPISWEYFNTLYTKEKHLQAEYRICPKISKNHLYLNSAAKMRIFSKSVTKGLPLTPAGHHAPRRADPGPRLSPSRRGPNSFWLNSISTTQHMLQNSFICHGSKVLCE
ncbi:hypothetical protein EAI_08236 [Harpegnathos saltator]|uniref:Transposable element P transposase n=1 Tax=Harpegnathos saltator TaxID=610380 RepID=E2BZZ4_HARSA|nr:hypothetical protein EAI_08236 [Harpegnathos saltator]